MNDKPKVDLFGLTVDLVATFVLEPLGSAWLLSDLWGRYVAPTTGWVVLPLTFWLAAHGVNLFVRGRRRLQSEVPAHAVGTLESIVETLAFPLVLANLWVLAWVVS